VSVLPSPPPPPAIHKSRPSFIPASHCQMRTKPRLIHSVHHRNARGTSDRSEPKATPRSGPRTRAHTRARARARPHGAKRHRPLTRPRNCAATARSVPDPAAPGAIRHRSALRGARRTRQSDRKDAYRSVGRRRRRRRAARRDRGAPASASPLLSLSR
jgi:hypothetical protein